MEARALERFDVTATQVCFPAAVQAARLTRFTDRKDAKADEVETEFLVSSRPAERLSTPLMFMADRKYWGIENGLHLRLDVSADEDRSRVRTPRNAFNLAMFRRAAMTFAIHWIHRCPNKRQATLTGFHDAMSANGSRKAFSLVTVCKPSWLP